MDSQFIITIIIVIIILVLLALEVCNPVTKSLIIGGAAGLFSALICVCIAKNTMRTSVAKCTSSSSAFMQPMLPQRLPSSSPSLLPQSLQLAPQRFESTYSHRGEGNIYDPDWRFYSGSTIKNLYGLTGVSGDTKLANRSIWQGTQSKRAQDIRARADKYNFAKWFGDGELDLQEKRVWWEDTSDIWEPYT